MSSEESRIPVVLSFSDLRRDPRVRRQIAWLAQKGKVLCVGYTDPEIEGADYVPIGPTTMHGVMGKALKAFLLLTHLYPVYWSFLSRHMKWQEVIRSIHHKTASCSLDFIYCNDPESLPLGIEIKKAFGSRAERVPVILDAHEYAFEEQGFWWWRLLFNGMRLDLFKTNLCWIDDMITVSDGIAREYEKVLGVCPHVVSNASDFWDLTPSMPEKGRIRMIHHGACIRGRGIEEMIELMELLDGRFSLDLMLVPSEPRYYAEISQKVNAFSGIRIVEPVPMDMIVPSIQKYDIGLYLLNPGNFNNKFALPNKFFEFVQARLCLAIGPSPEMSHLVSQYKLGLVSADFDPESMASELRKLNEESILEFKCHSHNAAQTLSSESNLDLFGNIMEEAKARKRQGLSSRFSVARFMPERIGIH